MFRTIDIGKAAVTAVVVLVVNVAVSFAVVAVYAYLIEPGHDDAFYQAAAQDIAPWSSVFAGALLFFAAAYWQTKRQPERNAILFAIAVVAIYSLIDIAVLLSQGVLQSMAGVVTLSLTTKLFAAIAGARIAARN